MRRRTTITLPDEPPRELTEFNPADWRAEDDHAALGLWMAARRNFCRTHGSTYDTRGVPVAGRSSYGDARLTIEID